MLIRLLGLAALILASTVAVADLHGHGKGGSSAGTSPVASAPELNPSVSGAGFILLGGGMLLLAERRRLSH